MFWGNFCVFLLSVFFLLASALPTFRNVIQNPCHIRGTQENNGRVNMTQHSCGFPQKIFDALFLLKEPQCSVSLSNEKLVGYSDLHGVGQFCCCHAFRKVDCCLCMKGSNLTKCFSFSSSVATCRERSEWGVTLTPAWNGCVNNIGAFQTFDDISLLKKVTTRLLLIALSLTNFDCDWPSTSVTIESFPTLSRKRSSGALPILKKNTCKAEQLCTCQRTGCAQHGGVS